MCRSSLTTLLTVTAALLVVGSAVPSVQAADISISEVLTLPSGAEVVGSSMLVRAPDGISMSLDSSGFARREALTVWWVVFNSPDFCLDNPCSLNDLFVPAVAADVLGAAAGNIAGGSGRSHFAGYLTEGDVSGSLADLFEIPGGPIGLVDAFLAEIHLVVRTHGEALRGQDLKEQLTTFQDSPCCEDIQFSIHQP